MARLPKSPSEAVRLLGLGDGSSVLAVGPAKGYVEGLSGAVGESGRVVVADPPPDLEAAGNVEVVEAPPSGTTWDAVVVWSVAVPAHGIRDLTEHVGADGPLWIVIPRPGKGPSPVHEADVKRALLAAGWRSDQVITWATDSNVTRFRRRRAG